MPHLLQLKSKLLNTVNKHYVYCGVDAPDRANREIEAVVDEIFLALGGCDKCDGRGYIIQTGDLCDCNRGVMLADYIKNKEGSKK